MITDIDRQLHYCPTWNSVGTAAVKFRQMASGENAMSAQTEDQADRERLIGDLPLGPDRLRQVN
jgi:hypothetical protein